MARGSVLRVAAVVIATVMLAGWADADVAVAEEGQNRTALQQATAAVIAAGALGVQLRVHDERGDWSGSAGAAELGSQAGVATDGRFRIGSITKTFVATVLLQLVGEGRIRLDDPVSHYLPQYGLDPQITVRMLLQHTSGLFNYTGESNPDGTTEPGLFPMSGKAADDSLFRDYQPDEFVRFALTKPARFAPGTAWSYSSTNYILAALLIEKVTGTPYGVQVYGRIVVPLGLWGTVVPGHWTGIPSPYARGYDAYKEGDVLNAIDVTNQNPSWAYSAGEIISTTQDLDTFITALLGGRLLAPALLAEMRNERRIGPTAGYGFALVHIERTPHCDFVGHDGGLPGYYSDMFSTIDGSRRVELSVTQGPTIDSHDDNAVNKLIAAIGELVGTAICGG
ncbi:beta-lactamase family protein [Nocardia colli]|uniref:Beta-lactamase family protein n=1 Tax=Nocardia colli TaxID=2545717 RepID=A0A5N0EFQ2_9NOCA|nr:serine hydrolase domain-containing protein [Nocardia colli]KAA8886241.1 beta-lactamase family protein [Nocardia colli]